MYIDDRVQKIREEAIADAVDQSRTDVFYHVHNVIHFKIGSLTPCSHAVFRCLIIDFPSLSFESFAVKTHGAENHSQVNM